MSIKTRQRIGYMAMLALSAATALILYPIIHKPTVLLHHAEILSREGRTAESDALVAQAVEAGANRPAAVLRAARIYLEEGRKTQAVDLLNRAMKAMRTIPPGLAGRMAGLLDTYNLSDEALAIILHTKPERRTRSERLYLGDLLRRQQRYEEAITEYEDLLRGDPSDREANLRLVETLAWKGDLAEALPLARDLVRAEPEDRTARLLLARILNWSGHVDEAEIEYKRLLGEDL